ncbi:MAG: PAS domain-containing protein [Myxococcales bacterium]|nr:PAS domain-containing protein [Myxococcales bacterium]
MTRAPTDRARLSPLGEEILDAVADALVSVDADGTVLTINLAAEGILGVSRRSFVGCRLSDAFADDRLAALHHRAMSSGNTIHEAGVELPTRLGPPRRVNIVASPLIEDATTRTIGTVLTIQSAEGFAIHDDDERRRERLAQVGILASGLAHEIKNPLGGIKGAAQLLQREVRDLPSLAKHTEVIIKEANRVNDLIGQLLDFAKPKLTNIQGVNLNRLLNEILLLQAETPEGRRVALETEFDPSIPEVLGDTKTLTSAFLNLVRNALEASPFDGRLVVRTRVVTDYVLVGEAGTRRKVIRVDIEDDGPGIAREDLEKIFTPFYTTKHDGTGLGLAISHQIILDHHGRIELVPRRPRGTRAEVFLPSAPSESGANGKKKGRKA